MNWRNVEDLIRRNNKMIKVISIIGCIFVFIMWIWYELEHPMEDDTENDEVVKFGRKSDKNKRT